MSSELGALDLNAHGTRVLAWRDDWHQTHVLSLSDFAPVLRSERFNHQLVGLHPGGERMVKLHGETLRVIALDGRELTALSLPWAHPARVLIVPEDRERLLDLTAGTEISRKLPVAQAKVRHFFTSLFSRYARAATRFSQRSLLAEVRYWDHKTLASGAMTYRAGSDGSFGAFVLPSMLFRQMADGTLDCAPLRIGGASATGGPGRASRAGRAARGARVLRGLRRRGAQPSVRA